MGGGFLREKYKETARSRTGDFTACLLRSLLLWSRPLSEGAGGVGIEVKVKCMVCGFPFIKLQHRNDDGEGLRVSKPNASIPVDLQTGDPVRPFFFSPKSLLFSRASQWLIAVSSQARSRLLAHLSESLGMMEIQSLWEKLVTCWDEPF